MNKQEAIERIKQNKAAAEFYAQMIGNYRSAENELKDIEAFNLAIKALQDRPKGDWIPCSEKLPNYREAVLVSTFWGVRMAERDSVKEDGTDDFWYLFLDDATARQMYVYAWMPLPEPYREESEVEE